MRLKRLTLTDFRACAFVDLKPGNEINVLAGDNAQGKSTILEAIYLLATTRSPRANKEAEMIRWGQETSIVSGSLERSERADVDLEISFGRTTKRVLRVNQTRRARMLDVVGQLNAVLFSADDLNIVRGEPSGRRRFLNMEISQVSPQYCHALLQYRRILEQRNRLLKMIRDTGQSTETLSVWNDQLVAVGSRMTERRISFLAELSCYADRIHRELAGAGELRITYQPSFSLAEGENVAEAFQTQLEQLRRDEVARGVTLVGPHRDDLTFTIDGVDIRVYGSQGQQRSVALAMKLAEVELMRERVGEPPLLL
ncbi:MAG TPA: DNA replication/repair protein RecF, partial [Armatimonadota bacterium]|nr:DNA replication/repair protein RecF [Armatimonadota bacterium]